MTKSFIKFKPVTSHSESHNLRKRPPKYLVVPSNENVNIVEESITERRKKLQKIVKQKTGRKMQSKSTVIKEAVVLLPDNNNALNTHALLSLSDELEKRYGIKIFQIHIHNDEGYTNEEGTTRYNYHAHILADWLDHNTGKSLRLTKEDMSEIQTITAEILCMERGEKGSKSLSLTHQEWRGFMEARDSWEKKQSRKITAEEEKELRQEIINKRDENTRRNSKGIRR